MGLLSTGGGARRGSPPPLTQRGHPLHLASAALCLAAGACALLCPLRHSLDSPAASTSRAESSELAAERTSVTSARDAMPEAAANSSGKSFLQRASGKVLRWLRRSLRTSHQVIKHPVCSRPSHGPSLPMVTAWLAHLADFVSPPFPPESQ